MIGIVILNYNTWEITLECVLSIRKTLNIEYNIYIVDNNSLNDSFDYLMQNYSECNNIKVIKNLDNGGFAKGNNIGIRAAIKDKCKYILVTNNDVIFKENCIEELYNFIQNNSNTVIVGPRILTPEGDIQVSITYENKSLLEFMGISGIVSLEKYKKIHEEYTSQITQKVYSVSGCCLMINATKFIKMGAFDEGTFLYNEESIFSFQANKLKYDIFYLPKAEVIHNHGTTIGKMNLFICAEFLKSSMYYWKKYYHIRVITLYLMWLYFTFKYLIKSVYTNELRKGWSKYFKSTLMYLMEVKKNV
ncbi:glycosyltransferase family 2 protein [Clostridium sp. DL1XJH146]